VHRSDSSGTTDNFTKYLSTAASSDWTYGHDKTWKAPGGDAEKGSDGVASALGKNDGAIGYVEWSFAQANNLKTAKIGNGAGEFVELTAEAAGKTIADAKVEGVDPNDQKLTINYNTTASGAYPIVLVTYEITCEKGNSATVLPLIKGFLAYAASKEGQDAVVKLGYAPLPESVRSKVAASVSALS
jgi:phosphate transport system substrate-binding protein